MQVESERGICWRVEDSLSLRAFLGIATHETTPDHSTLSRMRWRPEDDGGEASDTDPDDGAD